MLIESAAENFPGIGHYSWGLHVGFGPEAFWVPDTTSQTALPRLPQKGILETGNDSYRFKASSEAATKTTKEATILTNA